MKCQSLFSGKNVKSISRFAECFTQHANYTANIDVLV